MKNLSISAIIVFLLLWTLFVSACSVVAVKAVEALTMPTSTAKLDMPTPMPTATRIPATLTRTSVPTATAIPATSTPARMDLPVKNASLQIEVVDSERPYQIHLSDEAIFTPGAGNMFLGLGIRVTNLTNSEIPFKWNELYLFNEYQDKWYPLWGAYKKTNLAIDPLGIEVYPFKLGTNDQPNARVYFGDNGYMRVIFRVPRDNDFYYLAFADLPSIEIDYETP